jgi:hypothetical protein
MSSKKTYAEKLKNPKWQKKRLEVLEAFGFQCLECDSTEKTLHVHHLYYENGSEPWEYPLEAFEALCEDCHKKAEKSKKELKDAIKKLSSNEIPRVAAYIYGYLLTGGDENNYVPECFHSLHGFLDATVNSKLAPVFAKKQFSALCTNKHEPLGRDECSQAILNLKNLK